MLDHKVKQEKSVGARESKGKQGRLRSHERNHTKKLAHGNAGKQSKRKKGIMWPGREKQGKPKETQRKLEATSHTGLASLAS